MSFSRRLRRPLLPYVHGFNMLIRLAQVCVLLLLFSLAIPAPGNAQDDAAGQDKQSAAQTNANGMPENPGEVLQEMSSRLEEAAAELRSGLLSKERLAFWRDKLDALRERAQTIADAAERRLQSIRPLLEALGTPPEDGSEPPPVATERDKLNDQLQRYVALQKRAELILARIKERQRDLIGTARARFTDRLLTQGPTIIDPATWQVAGKDFLSALKRAWTVFIKAPSQTEITGSWREAAPLNLVVLGLAVIVVWPFRHFLLRRYGRDRRHTSPSYVQRLIAAIVEGVLYALVPAVAIGAIYVVLDSQGLLVGLIETLAQSTALAVVFFALVHGLTRAALAPDAPDWRVIHFTDACAIRLGRTLTILAAFFALDFVIFRLGQAMQLSQELAVVHNTLAGAVVAGLILRLMSPRFWRREMAAQAVPDTRLAAREPVNEQAFWEDGDEDSDTGAGNAAQTLGIFAMTAAGLMALAIPVSAALGYYVLARFLTERMILTGVLLAALLLSRGLLHELAAHTLQSETSFGRTVARALGLSATGLESLRFWLIIPADLILLGGGTMMILPLWGIGWDVIGTWLSTLLFGFDIGGITISLIDIALAIGVFFAALALSRFVQRVLDRQVFRQARMDVGVRHSLNAAMGYTGLILAMLLAIAALGLDLSNLAIIAGALSVGIGFGLQTIVNNFVSGLILLAERPVKVGDWVVVGQHEGFVKKVNVRATEIETFDRSSVIVPNSDFVSTAVTNWTHKNRQCRLIVKVRVPYGCDTAKVYDLLLACAHEHPEIARWPQAHVLFMDFGDHGLIFELRCYARDVDNFLTAPSDLRFMIDARLRAAGITIPLPAQDIYVRTVPWPDAPEAQADTPAHTAAGTPPGTSRRKSAADGTDDAVRSVPDKDSTSDASDGGE